MFGSFDAHEFRAGLPALRTIHPGLVSLEAWAAEHWAQPAR
ncbi:hypothetical protein [Streptomyces sp. NBC_00212]